MEFFGRESEIGILRHERELSHHAARFTVVTGRRRVGKTELVEKALNDGTDDYLYLLLGRKGEKTLCQELKESVEAQLGEKAPPLGNPERLSQLVSELVKLAKAKPLTLVFDEFQEMDVVNPGFYGELQGIWDRCHRTHKLNLVVSGSVNRLMNKIMFNYGEPLFGRNTAHLQVRPFPVSLLKTILKRHSPGYRPVDLLDLWTMTGGVARYVALLMDAGAVKRKKMLQTFFSEASPFIEEGRIVLSQEFGGDSATYFTILGSIARGHTRYNEIEQDYGAELGSFMSNLERNYCLIRKVLPAYAPRTAKNAAYRIDDPFFRFWFRYVFRNAALIELRRFDRLRESVSEDMDTFSGFALERYFWWKFAEESDYVAMGPWWDRKGENEIDLVCEKPGTSKGDGTLDFYEIKRDEKRIDLALLEEKVKAFYDKNPNMKSRHHRCQGLSLKDM